MSHPVNSFLRSLWSNKWLWITLLAAGLLYRLLSPTLFFESADYTVFLSRWVEAIRDNGAASASAYVDCNYNLPYVYILSLVARIPGEPLVAIKLVSTFFDYIAALFVALIVAENAGATDRGRWMPWAAAAVVSVLPTVIINSQWWAQCDSIYASLTVASIFFALRRRWIWSMVMLGLAFSFKLQTVFIFPLFLIFMLRGDMKWWLPFVAIATWLVTLLPALFIGYSISDAVSVYLIQTGEDSINPVYGFYPNPYIGLSKFTSYYPIIKTVGSIIGIALVGAVSLIAGIRSRKISLNGSDMLLLAVYLVLLATFTLPAMHERYAYLADVISIALVFSRPRLWWIALTVNFCSLVGYLLYFSAAPTSALAILQPAARIANALLLAAMSLLVYRLLSAKSKCGCRRRECGIAEW